MDDETTTAEITPDQQRAFDMEIGPEITDFTDRLFEKVDRIKAKMGWTDEQVSRALRQWDLDLDDMWDEWAE